MANGLVNLDLKSSMDRFIDFLLEEPIPYTTNLKSSMDRFIDIKVPIITNDDKI